jgi:hypothetical protein
MSNINRGERGKWASIEGFANEKIVCGLLMKRYGNVSLVDLPLSPYDIILVRKIEEGKEDIIRLQVKTASDSLKFTGGERGGVDRIYKSNVKTYVQSPELSDCIVGICFEGEIPALYFFPTLLIPEINQKSISLNKIQAFKNNYEILENCKDRNFVINKAKEYGILP